MMLESLLVMDPSSWSQEIAMELHSPARHRYLNSSTSTWSLSVSVVRIILMSLKYLSEFTYGWQLVNLSASNVDAEAMHAPMPGKMRYVSCFGWLYSDLDSLLQQVLSIVYGSGSALQPGLFFPSVCPLHFIILLFLILYDIKILQSTDAQLLCQTKRDFTCKMF